MYAMAAVTIVAAAASAYAQYDSTKRSSALQASQAQSNRTSALLQSEQARTASASLAIAQEQSKTQALEQENERQRRAGVADSAGRAAAAFAGFDLDSSSSLRALAAENERLVRADVGAIRLLGQSRQLQIMGEQRNVEARGFSSEAQARMSGAEANAWAATGRTAWVAPTARLLQSGYSTYRAT